MPWVEVGGTDIYYHEEGQGQPLVVLPGPMEFVMGAPVTETGRQDDERDTCP